MTLSKNVQNVRSTCMASEGMTDITLVTTSSDLRLNKGKRLTLRYIRGLSILHNVRAGPFYPRSKRPTLLRETKIGK